jgi:hypothetical protein
VVLQPHPSEGKDVTLRRVALVNSLGFNLLSVSQLLDEGFEVRFKSGESRLLNPRGDLVCMIIPEGQIFRADFSRSLGPARCLMAGPSSNLWKCEGPIRRTREGGSEWEPIKILLEGDGNSYKMNTASNTRLRLTTKD